LFIDQIFFDLLDMSSYNYKSSLDNNNYLNSGGEFLEKSLISLLLFSP